MTRPALVLACIAALAAAGCQEHEFHPPSEEERLSLADSLYSPSLFDTLTWASDSARVEAGNLVFAEECRRCHGPVGRGSTAYAEEHDLAVPSLVAPDWEFADDTAGVRRRIFTGHTGGMPGWGAEGLTARQVDAVAYYLLEQLRPELLSDSASIPPFD